MGQSMVLVSGSMTIQEGTLLRLEGPITWTIEPGASVSNSGVIDLGTEATLVEPLGGPIQGLGTERATLEANAPFANLVPGGLGLQMTSSDASGPFTIVRGHVPFVLPEGDHSIARWYSIASPSSPSASMDLVMQYDESELGLLEESVLSVFKASTEVGPWTTVAGSLDTDANTLAFSQQYPWAINTAFDEDAPTLSPTLIAQNGFEIWPTVVEDVLNIVSRSQQPIELIEVFDGMGRVVPKVQQGRSTAHHVLEMNGLASGTYFLRVNGSQVFKFRRA